MSATALSTDVFRIHGGKVETARALFPQAVLPWMDLSTGISPWAYPVGGLRADAFTRLPEPEALAGLEAAAAGYLGVAESARVVATPGSDLALRLLGRLFLSSNVGVVRPGYSGHVLAWAGTPIRTISVEALESAAQTHDLILLANPNNPDGRCVERGRLLAIAATLAARGGALVVDEAFADVSPALSLCENQVGNQGEGLIVFRSFGKFFGLAGVRLGFVIAGAEVAGRFRQALGDWPLSGLAIEIGTRAYRDREWQAAQRARLVSSAQRLDALLGRAGLAVAGGTSLFRLARCPDADVTFRRLAAHSILTRPFSSDGTLLRIGIPADELQWARLSEALESRFDA